LAGLGKDTWNILMIRCSKFKLLA